MKLSAIKPISRVLVRELAVTALLLFGVSVVVFAILYLAPGDPLNVLLEGQSPRSELALGMREALGVPRTWYGQYAAWFGKMLQGNFGNSIRTGLPVLPELARVGVNTLTLTLGSLALTLLLAVPIAVHAAARGDPGRVRPLGAAGVLVRLHRGLRFHPSVRHVPADLGNGGEADARVAVFPRADLRARNGERHALRDDPPPARGAVARAGRGLHPHRARQGRASVAPRVQGGFPDSGHRDHERQDPVPARRRGDRRAGVQLARHEAHGVAGGAGPRLPGHYGHCPCGGSVRAPWQPAAASRLHRRQPARFERIGQPSHAPLRPDLRPRRRVLGAAAVAARGDSGPGLRRLRSSGRGAGVGFVLARGVRLAAR